MLFSLCRARKISVIYACVLTGTRTSITRAPHYNVTLEYIVYIHLTGTQTNILLSQMQYIKMEYGNAACLNK